MSGYPRGRGAGVGDLRQGCADLPAQVGEEFVLGIVELLKLPAGLLQRGQVLSLLADEPLKAQMRGHPGMHLGLLDRLGDIVHGAGGKPLGQVLDVGPGRDEDTGISPSAWSCLKRRQVSKPSISGIITSSSTRSGSTDAAMPRALAPLVAKKI